MLRTTVRKYVGISLNPLVNIEQDKTFIGATECFNTAVQKPRYATLYVEVNFVKTNLFCKYQQTQKTLTLFLLAPFFSFEVLFSISPFFKQKFAVFISMKSAILDTALFACLSYPILSPQQACLVILVYPDLFDIIISSRFFMSYSRLPFFRASSRDRHSLHRVNA